MESCPQVAPSVSTAPMRLMVVEDRPAYLHLIQQLLTGQTAFRCTTVTAASLATALEQVERSAPGAILLDLGLPDSFGLPTYTAMREAAPQCPIVLMTAAADDDLARRAIRLGAEDFLRKEDITVDTLTRALSFAVERARAKCAARRRSADVFRAQDADRRRIGRDLRAMTNEKLAALSMELEAVARGLPPGDSPARRALGDCRGIAASCSEELLALTSRLHPPLLDDLGLTAAVRDLADTFAEQTGLLVDLEIAEDWPPLDDEASLALYLVLQESLHNILRHSGSRTASIRLIASDLSVSLSVQDTGTGWLAASATGDMSDPDASGVGIAMMKQRMQQLGGRLVIQSTAEGTIVQAELSGRRGTR